MNPEGKVIKALLNSVEGKYRAWLSEIDQDNPKEVHRVYSRYQQERHKILSDYGLIPVDENI